MAHYHAELADSSLAVAKTITTSDCTYHSKMVRLSWTAWLVSVSRQYSPTMDI